MGSRSFLIPGRRRIITSVVSARVLALLAFFGTISGARAEMWPLVASESTWDVLPIRVRLPSELVGEAAAQSLAGTSLSSPQGSPTATVPAGFPGSRLHGHSGVIRGQAPFGVGGPADCSCATSLGDSSAERVAAAYATKSFVATREQAQASTLQIRARYGDGLVVWLNGVRLVRAGLDAHRGATDSAWGPRGPEWESFYVSVAPGTIAVGENLLAVEVRPSQISQKLRLDLELTALSGPPQLVTGPMVQRVSGSTATVVFHTDVPSTAAVDFWSATRERVRVSSAYGSLAVRHVVEISGLQPSELVHYRPVVAGQALVEHTFHASPAAGTTIRFAVYGDMRGGHAVHARLLKSIAEEAPDFVVLTGDMVLRGSDGGDWQRFFKVAGDLLATVPFYPAAGNHDMGKSGVERRRMVELFELFPGPDTRPEWGQWYSFDVADLHFIMLDSNSYESKEQLDWLTAELQQVSLKGPRATFALTHDGPYSRGLHRGNRYAAAQYVPKLAAANVSYLFSGHDHLYQRGRAGGLDYIVSGGGGAPLYSIRCGVKGKRKCKVNDGMIDVESEHHYVMVRVFSNHVELCPKRIDGSPLKPCTKKRLQSKAR